MEIKRPGCSYTVDTLEELRKRFGPRAEIYLIVGSDTLDEFPTWKDLPRIAQLSQIVVVARPDYPLEKIDELKNILGENKVEEMKGLMLSAPLIGISASEIRSRVARGDSIRYLVPRTVERYIKKHKLYSYGKRQKGVSP
jgi:nicotinate-nucleotide adenylyltransferase